MVRRFFLEKTPMQLAAERAAGFVKPVGAATRRAARTRMLSLLLHDPLSFPLVILEITHNG